MKLPTEIRDLVVSFIVYTGNIVELDSEFPGLKWYIIHGKTPFWDWKWISYRQTLSESFMRSFHDQIDWVWVSIHQKISEPFIREFSDKVDWFRVSRNQTLSESFIREFREKLNWERISYSQTLSETK